MALPAEDLRLQMSPLPTPSGATVTPVQTSSDADAFLKFPYALYKGDPNWVPPLLMERKDFLDPRRNPFFEFGKVQLFLARQGSEMVGRIAAISNPRYDQFHGTRTGWFGFLECINDAGVAASLLDAAAAWCRAHGATELMGPASFSSNHEWGTLVEGFDAPPSVLMAYNPRYYPTLFEACGLTKAKDLYAFELSSSAPVPEKVARVAEKLRQREGVTVRPLNMKRFDEEVAKIKEIYNSAWEKNWGFVPMTDKEFAHQVRELKSVVDPELLLLAEVKGEAVAFSMTLPDLNIALKAAQGRLTHYGLPIGLIKLLWASRRISRARLVTLGIKEGFRRRGLDAILYLDTLRTAKRLGYTGGEISWTLEDNALVNRAIESMGGRQYKTYRVYQRDLRP